MNIYKRKKNPSHIPLFTRSSKFFESNIFQRFLKLLLFFLPIFSHILIKKKIRQRKIKQQQHLQ